MARLLGRRGPVLSGLTLGVLLLLATPAPVVASGLEAGVASVRITPPTPFWMSGYAARTRPSEGVLRDLWAKALAVRDAKGGRVVFVTVDLIGLSREIAVSVTDGASRRFGLDASQILLNASHTHCGPVVHGNLPNLFDFDLDPDDRQAVESYGRELTGRLVGVIGRALEDLAPARLSVGHGSAGFAVNRRVRTPEGYRIGVNRDGPVDHDVPVLKVAGPDGALRAVLFGYACHNTTLRGDVYVINGDYAGEAQAKLESAHPGARALFVMLCGGDQNPHPREKLELAPLHGRSLAEEVSRVLRGDLRSVGPPVRTAFEEIPLAFAPHTRAAFEEERSSDDGHRRRRAEQMLAAYDRGAPVHDALYPVQAVRLGSDLTIVALGGEVVVDYALRLKREHPDENLVVAGYSRDVMCYIPSRRVLEEGGYEAVESHIYYGTPGPLAPEVEETIVAAVGRVLEKTRSGSPGPR